MATLLERRGRQSSSRGGGPRGEGGPARRLPVAAALRPRTLRAPAAVGPHRCSCPQRAGRRIPAPLPRAAGGRPPPGAGSAWSSQRCRLELPAPPPWRRYWREAGGEARARAVDLEGEGEPACRPPVVAALRLRTRRAPAAAGPRRCSCPQRASRRIPATLLRVRPMRGGGRRKAACEEETTSPGPASGLSTRQGKAVRPDTARRRRGPPRWCARGMRAGGILAPRCATTRVATGTSGSS